MRLVRRKQLPNKQNQKVKVRSTHHQIARSQQTYKEKKGGSGEQVRKVNKKLFSQNQMRMMEKCSDEGGEESCGN